MKTGEHAQVVTFLEAAEADAALKLILILLTDILVLLRIELVCG